MKTNKLSRDIKEEIRQIRRRGLLSGCGEQVSANYRLKPSIGYV